MNHIHGTVTYTNKNLWTFTIDNKHTLSMAYLLATNDCFHLFPNVNDKITVTNERVGFDSVVSKTPIVLCDNSIVTVENDSIVCSLNADSFFVELIREFKLGASDLLMLYKCVSVFKERFGQILSDEYEIDLLHSVAKFLNSKSLVLPSKLCFNNAVLRNFLMTTISDCVFMDPVSKKFKGPYWYFGNHSKRKSCEILLGYLKICSELGIFMLMDQKYKIALVLKPYATQDLLKVVDNIVLIKNYTIFTEIYNDEIGNLDYILCDIKDIEVVNCRINKTLFNKKEKYFCTVPHGNFKKQMNFAIRNKALPSLSKTSEVQCWLEIENLDVLNGCCICLKRCHLDVLPFLKEGCCYILLYNDDLKETNDIEIKRIYPAHKLYQLSDSNAVFFHKSSTISDPTNLTDVSEVLSKQTTVNFEGTIASRDFSDPLSSRTNLKVGRAGFGTSGPKTHMLKFKIPDSAKTLNLFLNNWECLQKPLGIVPNMRVLVRNAIVQKGTYCKSTPMTSFEVMDYEPPVKYESAVSVSERYDWSRTSHFHHAIPQKSLVISKIYKLFIISFSLKCVCAKCEEPCLNSKPCVVCKIDPPVYSLKPSLRMSAATSAGEALVLCYTMEVLQLILGIEKRNEWTKFCDAIKLIGSYNFDRFENDAENELQKVLNKLVNAINLNGMCNLKMVCRKLYSKPEDNDGKPLWMCVDAVKDF